MRLEDVEARIAEIHASDEGDDYEQAHVKEDWLAHCVIAAVAAGHPDSRAMAARMLPLLDGERIRWFA